MKHEDQQEPQAPALINACDWEFNEHQFAKDEPFVNPGLTQAIVDRAVQDGLVRIA